MKSDFDFKLNRIDFSNYDSFDDDDDDEIDCKLNENHLDDLMKTPQCKLIRSVSIYRRQQREVRMKIIIDLL